MSIQEIKEAVANMPPDEQREFAAWYLHYWKPTRPTRSAEEIAYTDRLVKEAGDRAKAHRRERTRHAIEGLRRARKGVTLGPDITIRELIEEGRI